jgi:serine/threonine protein kinase
MAPEQFNREKGHSYGADVWATGVIMYYLLYGECPFIGSDLKALSKLIIEGKVTYPKSDMVSDNAVDLMQGLLSKNESQRLTPTQILSHPWFQQNRIPKNVPLSFLKEAPSQEFLNMYPISKKIMNKRT